MLRDDLFARLVDFSTPQLKESRKKARYLENHNSQSHSFFGQMKCDCALRSVVERVTLEIFVHCSFLLSLLGDFLYHLLQVCHNSPDGIHLVPHLHRSNSRLLETGHPWHVKFWQPLRSHSEFEQTLTNDTPSAKERNTKIPVKRCHMQWFS